MPSLATRFQERLWQLAGIVSVFAVVCGTVVTCLAFGPAVSDLEQGAAAMEEKSQVEDDAYDVVSARG